MISGCTLWEVNWQLAGMALRCYEFVWETGFSFDWDTKNSKGLG